MSTAQTGINIVVTADTVRAAQNLNAFVAQTTARLKVMATSLAAFAGVGVAGYGFASAIREGIRFNATLQDATLGIAAIQKQFNPDRFKDFSDAIKVSASAVDLLREKAVRSPASFQQLVQSFQGVTGAATSAGISLKNQVDLVVLTSQALAGLGIRSEQILQESRALITGNINEDAMAARILGITKADIEQAKAAGQLYEFLTGKLQAFAEAGEVGAKNFTTAFSNLRDVLEQKLGRATETLFQKITEGLLALTDVLNSSDIFAKVDGFVAVVINFWKAGRIDELIGLTIQAGFEQGKLGIEYLWEQLKALFTSDNALRLIFNFAMTLTREIAKAFVDLSVFLGSALANITGVIFQKIQEQAVAGINAIINTINKSAKLAYLMGGSIEPLGTSNSSEESGKRAAEIRAGGQVLKDAISNFFNEGIDASNSLFGGQGTNTNNATERLKQLIEEQIKLRDAAKQTAEITDNTTPAKAAFDVKRILATQEIQLKERLLALENARANIEGNFALSDANKWELRRRILLAEIASLEESRRNLQAQAAAAPDDASRQLLNQREASVTEKLGGVQTDLASSGPNPNSFSQSLKANVTDMLNSIGTLAQNAASIVTNTLGAAFNGIGDKLANIILVTGDWKNGLLDIARTVVSTLLGSFIQFFVNILARSILNAIIGSSIQAAAAASSAAIWAGPAILAATATFGAAAAQAPASVAAAMAFAPAIAALSGAGFAEGGYTGAGGKYEVAGLVHRGEYVVPADEVQRHGGPGSIAAMIDGKAQPVASAGRSPTVVNVLNFDDPNKIQRFLESHVGEKNILNIVDRNRGNLGFPT